MINNSTDVNVYNKLTPVSDADLVEYEDALLYALTEKDIRNIAITGVYGSGKSSLKRTGLTLSNTSSSLRRKLMMYCLII